MLLDASFESAVATVRRAVELGIRYFDTSPRYAGNLSQPAMGEGLADAPPETMIATKVGEFSDPGDFRSEGAIRRQIEDNLRLLKRDRVEVLQVHEANMNFWWEDGADHPWMEIDPAGAYDFDRAPVLKALRKARDEGLCRYIGITGNVSSQMSQVLESVDVDTFLVAFSYDPIVRNAEDDAFPLAERRGVALILGAIFYGGRLAAVHPEWLESPPDWMRPQLAERFGRLYATQKECGIPMAQLTLRFALSRKGVSVILIGAARPEEIEESVRAVQDGPLPEDIHREIESLGLHGVDKNFTL